MSEELDLLKIVCRKLENAGMQYMLTGSLAANFYAVPRMTRDLDFVIEVLEPKIELFAKAFQSDFYVDTRSIIDAIKHQSMFNIIHNNSIFKVDFIIRKDSEYRATEFKRRRQTDLDGTTIWIVSPEDLIISKLCWAKDSHSAMQLGDIKNLLNSIKKLDQKYIDQWVRVLQLDEIYKKAQTHE